MPKAGAIIIRLIFEGDALKKNDFSLILNINNGLTNSAEVKVLLEAELNPMLKMMAKKPIQQFLEILDYRDGKFKGLERYYQRINSTSLNAYSLSSILFFDN